VDYRKLIVHSFVQNMLQDCEHFTSSALSISRFRNLMYSSKVSE
jgi:hypothetical protein